MDEKRKQGLKWLAGVGLAASPYVGGVIVTAILLKRRRARRCKAQEAGFSGRAGDNEVRALRTAKEKFT